MGGRSLPLVELPLTRRPFFLLFQSARARECAGGMSEGTRIFFQELLRLSWVFVPPFVECQERPGFCIEPQQIQTFFFKFDVRTEETPLF